MSLQLDQRRRAMLAEMGVHLPPAAVTVHGEEPADAHVSLAIPDTARNAAASTGAGGPAFSPNVSRPGTEPSSPSSSALTRAGSAHAIGKSAPPAVRPAPTMPPPAPRLSTGLVADLSWSALQQTVAGCEACNLCQHRRNTVFGTGAPEPSPGEAPQVDWMIVGEAPGEHEDQQGEPFVGQAGRLLDNMLKAVGLERHAAQASGGRVYIANVLKCRPPGNRNPHPDEVARCEPYLRRQVALLRPRIIVAMGRFAVQSLLRDSVADIDTQPLGRLRGQVYAYEGVPVVVTYHPAYLLRSPSEKRKAWQDLVYARQLFARLEREVAGAGRA